MPQIELKAWTQLASVCVCARRNSGNHHECHFLYHQHHYILSSSLSSSFGIVILIFLVAMTNKTHLQCVCVCVCVCRFFLMFVSMIWVSHIDQTSILWCHQDSLLEHVKNHKLPSEITSSPQSPKVRLRWVALLLSRSCNNQQQYSN